MPACRNGECRNGACRNSACRNGDLYPNASTINAEIGRAKAGLPYIGFWLLCNQEGEEGVGGGASLYLVPGLERAERGWRGRGVRE